MGNNKIHLKRIKLISLILLLSFIVISCNGQVQTSSDTFNARRSTTNLTVKNAKKDPLFFIDGQLCQHLRKIFQDRSGNLWFGTNVYDIMRYNGDTLEYFSEKDGFSGGRVTGIVEDNEGNVWFGTSKGLTKYDEKSFSIYTEKDGLLNNEIWSLIIDVNGIFWIGTNAGLSRFDGNTFFSISIPKAQVEEVNSIYSPDRITGIAEDKEGNLWFGTDGYGICKYDGKTFTNFTMENGLCDNTIYELMIDSRGNLWIGSFWGGVSKYDGKRFTNFTKDGIIKGVEVSAFFEDDNGDIWFAAENHGVYCYDGSTFTNLYEEEGLKTNGVLSIYKDRKNRFWFGGWGGLFRYDGKSFLSVTIDGPWEK